MIGDLFKMEWKLTKQYMINTYETLKNKKRIFIYTLITHKVITKKITTVKKVLIEKIYQTILETVSLAIQTPGIS